MEKEVNFLFIHTLLCFTYFPLVPPPLQVHRHILRAIDNILSKVTSAISKNKLAKILLHSDLFIEKLEYFVKLEDKLISGRAYKIAGFLLSSFSTLGFNESEREQLQSTFLVLSTITKSSQKTENAPAAASTTSTSVSASTFTSTSTSTSTCSPLVVQLHQKTLSPPCFTFLSSNSIPTGKTPSFSMSSTSCRPFTSLSPSSTSLSSNKPFYSNRSSSHYNRSGSSSSNSSNDLNPILSALRLSGIFILALGITYLLLPVLIPLLVLLLCALVAAGLYFYRMRRNFFNTLNNSLKQHSNSTSPFSSSSSSTPTPPFPSSLFGRIFSPLQQPSSFDQSPLINLLQSFASKALSFDQFDNVFSLSSKLISNDPVAMRRLEEARRKHGGSSFTITPFQHNIQVDVQSNGSAQRVVIPKAVFQGSNSNNNGRSPAEPISVSIVARIISNAATTSSSSTTTVIGDNMVEIKSIKLGFPETQEEINVDLNGTTHKTEPNKRGKIIDAEVRDQ